MNTDGIVKRAVITVGEQMDEQMKYHLLLPFRSFKLLYDIALVKGNILLY